MEIYRLSVATFKDYLPNIRWYEFEDLFTKKAVSVVSFIE
jgi:hypothetical protein